MTHTQHIRISIPRADYEGRWDTFRQENQAFIRERELDRIERLLLAGESATHVAHTAGAFVINPIT